MMKKSVLMMTLIFICSLITFAADETGIIRGKVTTSDGNPAEAVTVTFKGTKRSAVTDEFGNFLVRNLEPGNYTLEISLVGHETYQKEVTVKEKETINITIELQVSSKDLQEVIVSGNKMTRTSSDYVSKINLKNTENSQVYTTITGTLMKQQMAFSVDDVIHNSPGVQTMWQATGRGGDGGAYYNMRGFIVQSQLRNGISGNITSRADAVNVDRIEVVKGPSATLFGSTLSSYGGLINRVTKKAYDHFGGEVSYAMGSYGFNRATVDINTPLDKDKKVLLRTNAAYYSEGAWRDYGFNKGFVFAPTLTYKASDRLSFNFDAEIYSSSNASEPFVFFYFPTDQLGAHNPKELGIDYKRSYSANNIFQKSKVANFFGQMNYKISDKWTSQTNVSSSYSNSDGPFAYYYLVPNTGRPGADSMVRAVQSTANSNMNVYEVQQNFIGDFKTGKLRHRVLAGLDYLYQNSDQMFYGTDFDIIPKNGLIPTYANFNRDNLNRMLEDGSTVWYYPYKYQASTYSAYVGDVVNITDYVIASAAVRVDRYDFRGNFDPTKGGYEDGYAQTFFSPRFGLVIQPIPDVVSIFGNYQNGFTNKPGSDWEGKSFDPEEAAQIEGGVKVNLLGGKLTSTLSYYNIKVKNVLRADPVHPNFSIQNGTQRSQGIEAEVIAHPVRGLDLVLGYAYNDSKFLESDEGVKGRRPDVSGSPHTFNSWVNYTFSGNLKGFGIGGGVRYQSDNMIVNSVENGVFTLPEFTLVDASVYYDQAKWRFGLKCNNLTNQEYYIGYTTLNPQQLRTIIGSVTFKF
ncbi:TonB-dependent receptor [Pseudoflavitalea rhizosphaerae]|uniref:TonB-dependent receptor n=1 Tax=Pseudoflavitalea rhizosphaerae TaxID=1884793 RepID=UPI0019D0A47F|nr:TonB-dependent receptor [Pseudoflavitalea rhizosphaerae]